MITRISIKDTATYDNEDVDTDNLTKILDVLRKI